MQSADFSEAHNCQAQSDEFFWWDLQNDYDYFIQP